MKTMKMKRMMNYPFSSFSSYPFGYLINSCLPLPFSSNSLSSIVSSSNFIRWSSYLWTMGFHEAEVEHLDKFLFDTTNPYCCIGQELYKSVVLTQKVHDTSYNATYLCNTLEVILHLLWRTPNIRLRGSCHIRFAFPFDLCLQDYSWDMRKYYRNSCELFPSELFPPFPSCWFCLDIPCIDKFHCSKDRRMFSRTQPDQCWSWQIS